jgi:hypothetical protein
MTDLYPSFAAATDAPDSWKTRRTADSFEPASWSSYLYQAAGDLLETL